jgi:hypothetical protein
MFYVIIDKYLFFNILLRNYQLQHITYKIP